MSDHPYNTPLYFPYAQGNKWTYAHQRSDESTEVTYVIEGAETFHGIEVPKKVQVENPEEYFCTSADPVYGIRDFKHHIGMAPEYLIYTPPAYVMPATMKPGDLHQSTSHLLRYNSDGTQKDTGSFYVTTFFEAVEEVSVPAGTFDSCLKLIITRDDVFSDMIINVVFNEWLAHGVGIVKNIARVTIYSPEGGDPFIAEAREELRQATVGGKKY